MPQPFYQSFQNAFKGLKLVFQQERNSKIQLFLMTVATSFGIIFQIQIYEWLVLLLCFGLVTSLEVFNSAIETLCNRVSMDYDAQIGKVKDMAAGAVLWASFMSFIIGLFIFIPHFIQWF